VSLPRPVLRVAAVAAAALALLGVGAGVASAHVTVSSPNAAAGGYGTVVFTVPTESSAANTTRVQVQVPDSTPLAQVLVQPVPGWTVTTTQRQLATPLTDDDGNSVSTVISVVDFTATAGGIPPGQFQQFTLSAGEFPDKGTFTFNVLQSYSDGTQAAWIDPTVAGQPEPEHPAPVLHLTAASDGAAAAPASSGTSPAASTSSSDSAPTGLTLFLAVLALVVALAAVVLALLNRRRTVGS
jgi:periplasmic copper chaperone A